MAQFLEKNVKIFLLSCWNRLLYQKFISNYTLYKFLSVGFKNLLFYSYLLRLLWGLHLSFIQSLEYQFASFLPSFIGIFLLHSFIGIFLLH